MRVRLKNVYVAYSGSRKPTIGDVTLNLDREVYIITDPNGAGKTTLLETIGFLKPYRGEAYLLGQNTKNGNIFRSRRKCSYVPQDFMKPPTEAYTSIDVIKLGIVFNRDGVKRCCGELAKKLSALDLLEKPFGKLSGSQQQKIMIIRGLARNCGISNTFSAGNFLRKA